MTERWFPVPHWMPLPSPPAIRQEERTRLLALLRSPGEEMVKAAAQAMAKAYYKHELGGARWEKFVGDARYTLAALADFLEDSNGERP